MMLPLSLKTKGKEGILIRCKRKCLLPPFNYQDDRGKKRKIKDLKMAFPIQIAER